MRIEKDGELNQHYDYCRSSVDTVRVCRVRGRDAKPGPDAVAVEEPLEVRLGYTVAGKRIHRAVSVTMRTPGNDAELAVGFLFTEGIITDQKMVSGVRGCGSKSTIRVDLEAGANVDLSCLERHFYTASSCGMCGKASLSTIRVTPRSRPPAKQPVLDPVLIHRLPERLRRAQAMFDRTGGLHAAALFDPDGQLLCLREDVGRHNAVDKLVGAQFLGGRVPLFGTVLLVSGRVSFELVQKAAMAGIPVLAAVGAPSSLAVELAREHGLTLLGFVRDSRFNVYTHASRVRGSSDATATARLDLPILEPTGPALS